MEDLKNDLDQPLVFGADGSISAQTYDDPLLEQEVAVDQTPCGGSAVRITLTRTRRAPARQPITIIIVDSKAEPQSRPRKQSWTRLSVTIAKIIVGVVGVAAAAVTLVAFIR